MGVRRAVAVAAGLIAFLGASATAGGAPSRPPSTGTARTQVVDVSTPTRADKARLQGLGLDLTEHGDEDSLEVVLYGDADAQRLRDAGFTYTVRIADLAARDKANR